MKYLIRRIKFAFTGHMMRALTSLVSCLAILILAFVMLSGYVNQRGLFEKLFGFTWNSSKSVANKIEQNDLPVEVTEDGVYLKNHTPEDVAKNKDKDSKNKNNNEKEDNKKDKEENDSNDDSEENDDSDDDSSNSDKK